MKTREEIQFAIMNEERALNELRDEWTHSTPEWKAKITVKGEEVKKTIADLYKDLSIYERIEKAKQNAKEVRERKGVNKYVK